MQHGLSADVVIGMSDVELVRRTFDLIARVDDAETSDALYFVTMEAFERFCPEAARRELEEAYDGDALNLRDAREGMRRRAATRMIRDALEAGGEHA